MRIRSEHNTNTITFKMFCHYSEIVCVCGDVHGKRIPHNHLTKYNTSESLFPHIKYLFFCLVYFISVFLTSAFPRCVNVPEDDFCLPFPLFVSLLLSFFSFHFISCNFFFFPLFVLWLAYFSIRFSTTTIKTKFFTS